MRPDTNDMRALKQLAQKAEMAKKQRYPSVPDHCLPKAKYSDITANGLTKAILSWLELNGHYASRIQSQGQWQQKLGRFTRSTVKRGIGDVTAIVNGRSVMIEVKIGKDKQSEWQKRTQAEVERSGGTYFIARDFDSFMQNYREWTKDREGELTN